MVGTASRWKFGPRAPMRGRSSGDEPAADLAVVVRCCGEWSDGSCWTRLDRLRIFDVESAPVHVKGAECDNIDTAPSLHCFRTFRFVPGFVAGPQSSVVCETQDDTGAADELGEGAIARSALLDEERDMWAIEATIKEEPGDTLGSHVWNSGVVLGMVLVARKLHSAPSYDRLTVLDLGSGCGISSIVAAKLGHAVTATDRGTNMLRLLSSNIKANHLNGPMCSTVGSPVARLYKLGTCRAAVLDWLDPEALLVADSGTKAGLESTFMKVAAKADRSSDYADEGDEGTVAAFGATEETSCSQLHSPVRKPCYDLILAGDVLYCTDMFKPLLRVLDTYSGAETTVLLAYSHRDGCPFRSASVLSQKRLAETHPFFKMASQDSPRHWQTTSITIIANIEVFSMFPGA